MSTNRSRSIRTKLLRAVGLPSIWEVRSRLEEIRYSQLWSSLQRQIGEPAIHPSTLGAANASLLFVLGRILTELPVSRVIEFGAGSTSKLIGHCASRSTLTAATIEHDPFWADHIAAQVSHPVFTCPLTDDTRWGITTQTYQLPDLVREQRFDLLVIDGPPGKPTHSRLGAVAQAVELADAEFILVLDDVDRDGEKQTVKALQQQMQEQGRRVDVRWVHAAKDQLIMCTPRFEAALYL